jgi:hypothetical protein
MSNFGIFFWDGHFLLTIETFKIHFILNFVISIYIYIYIFSNILPIKLKKAAKNG